MLNSVIQQLDPLMFVMPVTEIPPLVSRSLTIKFGEDVDPVNEVAWRNDKPPNERWVQVKDDNQVIEAMAFYGRDGYRPHWRLRDESCCHPSRFSRWREIPQA